MMKFRTVIWTWHEALMEERGKEKGYTCRLLVGKPEGKITLG
jgi:hypothetical protein